MAPQIEPRTIKNGIGKLKKVEGQQDRQKVAMEISMATRGAGFEPRLTTPPQRFETRRVDRRELKTGTPSYTTEAQEG